MREAASAVSIDPQPEASTSAPSPQPRRFTGRRAAAAQQSRSTGSALVPSTRAAPTHLITQQVFICPLAIYLSLLPCTAVCVTNLAGGSLCVDNCCLNMQCWFVAPPHNSDSRTVADHIACLRQKTLMALPVMTVHTADLHQKPFIWLYIR